MVTDYIRSYAIFTYRCGDLNTPGYHQYSTIGINADDAFGINHPLSGSRAITNVSCANGEWNNLVYELSSSAIEVTASQSMIGECWNYYALDIGRDASINSTLFSSAIENLPKCPCSMQQVIYDLQFYVDPEDSNCYISRFYQSAFGLGVYCCYQGSLDTG